jgi:hypothetical protein
METLKDIEQRVNCRNYLQSSTYVELNPEAWKQAIDLQGNSNDVFQTAYQIMEFIYSHYEYCNSTTSVDTSSTTVIREETRSVPGFCPRRFNLLPVSWHSRPVCKWVFL